MQITFFIKHYSIRSTVSWAVRVDIFIVGCQGVLLHPSQPALPHPMVTHPPPPHSKPAPNQPTPQTAVFLCVHAHFIS